MKCFGQVRKECFVGVFDKQWVRLSMTEAALDLAQCFCLAFGLGR